VRVLRLHLFDFCERVFIALDCTNVENNQICIFCFLNDLAILREPAFNHFSFGKVCTAAITFNMDFHEEEDLRIAYMFYALLAPVDLARFCLLKAHHASTINTPFAHGAKCSN
jgi:hypothetical protein